MDLPSSSLAACIPFPLTISPRQRAASRRGPLELGHKCFPGSSSFGGRSCLGLRSFKTHRLPQRLEPPLDVGRATAPELSGGEDGFDWLAHWYPVMWAQDLLEGKPTKVTLFDEEYCLLRRPASLGGDTMCLKDACPHRLAALSEGRMTSGGLLQCAYHGWSFDRDGTCVDIPTSAGGRPGVRTCTKSLPCEVTGGHVWIFPGGANGREPAGPPPVAPEMVDGSGWKYSTMVRDFPIDYSILVENITESAPRLFRPSEVIRPDHGLFAHQAMAFDWYTGSDKYPQHVDIKEDGTGFLVEACVASTNKLTLRSGTSKEELPKICAEDGPEGEPVPKKATSTFRAPCSITLCRRGRDGTAKFLTMFWVIPTGLGRSRFMSWGISKMPFSLPRWVLAVMTNNFLDQDSHLLATAQVHYLPWELQKARTGAKLDRRSLFCYQSPSENLLIAIGRFMDENLPSMPNRYSTKAMNRALEAGLGEAPSRPVVLDRWSQHTAICPTSQDVVRNATLLFRAAVSVFSVAAFATGAALSCAVRSAAPGELLLAVAGCMQTEKAWLAAAAVSGALAALCRRLVSEFSFRYTEDHRDKDLRGIPNVYPDAMARAG